MCRPGTRLVFRHSKRVVRIGTVIIITLECIRRSEVLLAPPKYNLRSHVRTSQGRVFSIGIAKGMEETPLNSTSASSGIGIMIHDCPESLADGTIQGLERSNESQIEISKCTCNLSVDTHLTLGASILAQ